MSSRSSRSRRRSRSKSWKIAALVLVGVTTIALVMVAVLQSSPAAVVADEPTATATQTATPTPTPTAEAPVIVSVLSDSHAFNADSWWRQTVWVGGIGEVTRGAFESQPGALASSLVPRLDEATALGGFVIVQAGTNDLLSNQGPQPAADSIEALWAGVRDRGAKPIAALVPPSNTHPAQTAELNALLRADAKAQGVPVLDVFSTVNAGDGSWGADLSIDGVHANRAGSDLMAQAARDQLPALIR